MVDKYNESSQLRVRLAILESQLKIANKKVQYLEKINKYKGGKYGIRSGIKNI